MVEEGRKDDDGFVFENFSSAAWCDDEPARDPGDHRNKQHYYAYA